MRIRFYNIKKNLWILFSGIAAFVLGILLIASAPDDSVYLNSLYYGNAMQYDKLCVTEFYPVGILGSETENGTQYTYYIASMRDVENVDFLFVLRSDNEKIAELLQNEEPAAFSGTIYGKALEFDEQIKSDFDELIAEQELDEKYKSAQWYFSDSSRNDESEAAICIICGFTLIIASFLIIWFFFRKATNKPDNLT